MLLPLLREGRAIAATKREQQRGSSAKGNASFIYASSLFFFFPSISYGLGPFSLMSPLSTSHDFRPKLDFHESGVAILTSHLWNPPLPTHQIPTPLPLAFFSLASPYCTAPHSPSSTAAHTPQIQNYINVGLSGGASNLQNGTTILLIKLQVKLCFQYTFGVKINPCHRNMILLYTNYVPLYINGVKNNIYNRNTILLCNENMIPFVHLWFV